MLCWIRLHWYIFSLKKNNLALYSFKYDIFVLRFGDSIHIQTSLNSSNKWLQNYQTHTHTHKHTHTHTYIYIYIGNISTLNGSSLKVVDKFTYLENSVSSTETDIDTRQAKAWTPFNTLSVIWKSDLTDKMKCSFFQAAVVSILLYGCTT